MFFIIEKSEETTFNFLQNSFTIIQIMETQNIVNLLNDSTLLTVKQTVVTYPIMKLNF